MATSMGWMGDRSDDTGETDVTGLQEYDFLDDDYGLDDAAIEAVLLRMVDEGELVMGCNEDGEAVWWHADIEPVHESVPADRSPARSHRRVVPRLSMPRKLLISAMVAATTPLASVAAAEVALVQHDDASAEKTRVIPATSAEATAIRNSSNASRVVHSPVTPDPTAGPSPAPQQKAVQGKIMHPRNIAGVKGPRHGKPYEGGRNTRDSLTAPVTGRHRRKTAYPTPPGYGYPDNQYGYGYGSTTYDEYMRLLPVTARNGVSSLLEWIDS